MTGILRETSAYTTVVLDEKVHTHLIWEGQTWRLNMAGADQNDKTYLP